MSGMGCAPHRHINIKRDTILNLISPSPSSHCSQNSAEGFFVWIGQTGRLDVVAPHNRFVEIDKSDVIGHLTRYVVGMHDNAIDGHHSRLLRAALLETVLCHADLKLGSSSTVTNR